MSPQDVVIFLGPSASIDDAKQILAARFMPPITRGDIARLMNSETPKVIGIIDGRFQQAFSVSPKEILYALDRGISVYGASSMGALRAMELTPYGMIGLGRIFDAFISGILDADDEVAMVYDPETLRTLSEPLVNIRFALSLAESLGVISPKSAAAFLNLASGLYFPERNYRILYRDAPSVIAADEVSRFRRFVKETKPDQKREDALRLISGIHHTLAAQQ